ncbi:hypothetical protein J4050_08645 [Winogradskyella sp. DF17]|uniref:Dockerin domain-containing protein n=1 Tax=Winogradskyella pelagia TaxID=2819984 RepID=A0ABS3T238_9FLAO|nr:hypothetical protein [Winogradskyella sp. DF17]MBO3116813.1 hypothetical protein [Winogradskyella sp. DF17]
MKSILFNCICLFIGLLAVGQSTEKSSIDSGGASSTIGNLAVVYSIGEVAVNEISAGSLIVSEGFIGPLQESEPDDNITFIPDPEFERWLRVNGYDTDETENGQVFTSDISSITSLFIEGLVFVVDPDTFLEELVDSFAINSFEGLQDFAGLTSFFLKDNIVGSNFQIDFSGNPQLEEVTIIASPRIESVNILNNELLTKVQIGTQFGDTTVLNALDIQNCPNLEILRIGSSMLNEINLELNPALTSLTLNCPINSLDVTNQLNLNTLWLNNTQIESLDVSLNSQLQTFNVQSNNNLSTINLQNGTNIQIQPVNIFDNINLDCVFVDDADYSINNWTVGDFNYVDGGVSIEDYTLIYDPNDFSDFNAEANQILDNWLNTAGFIACPNGDWTFDYTIQIDESVDNDFNPVTNVSFLTTFSNTDLNLNIPAVFNIEGLTIDAGESIGSSGELCGIESYSLFNIYTGTTNFDTRTVTQEDFFVVEPAGLEFAETPQSSATGFNVDFPDTGSGAFTYTYRVEVSKEFQFRDAPLVELTDNTFLTVNEQTVLFDTGESSTYVVSPGQTVTLQDLFDQIEGTPDAPRGNATLSDFFTPNTYQGPRQYVYDPTSVLTICAAQVEPSILNVIELDCDYGIFEFEDPGFEQYLLDQGIDKDGLLNNEVVICDVGNIETIEISSLYAINSLNNLGIFTGLKRFQLEGNDTISSIDFQENIDLQEISLIDCVILSSLNVSNNLGLRSLELQNTSSSFEVLDITQNFNLEVLTVTNSGIPLVDLSGNPELSALTLTSNPLVHIDISGNPNIVDLNARNNFSLSLVNLRNGANSSIDTVDLTNAPSLNCVLVDDVNFVQNNVNWAIDAGVFFTDDNVCTTEAIDETVTFDGLGNQEEVEYWLNNHGGAAAFSDEGFNWSYDITIVQTDFSILYDTTFTAEDGVNQFTTTAVFTINTSNFNAGADFEPVSGDVANGVQEEGGLCDLQTFDISTFKDTTPFTTGVFQNSEIALERNLDEGTGPEGTTINGTVVDFPDTGSGQFSYYYRFSVSKELQLFGVPEPITITDEASIWHWLVIPFDPGEQKTLNVCTSDIITLTDLYNALDIVDGTDDPNFNPDNYWSDTNGPVNSYLGPGQYTFNAGAFLPQCGAKPTIVTVVEVPCEFSFSTKVQLQGATINPINGEENLMRDNLRTGGFIPTTSPYPDGKTCDSNVFNISGNNAIVDWIWVELRDPNTDTTIISSTSGLLQRDGDVVDVDGISPLSFDVPIGSYYVVVNHRNHLGVMTANPFNFDAAFSTVDFTDSSTVAFGNNARSILGDGSLALWAGDVNGDGLVNFAGDVNTVLVDIILFPGNTTFSSSYSAAAGYLPSDVKLDGNVNFSDEINQLILSIILYPLNTSFSTSFNLFEEQLPSPSALRTNEQIQMDMARMEQAQQIINAKNN